MPMPIDRAESAHGGGDSLFHARDLIETSHRRARDLEREEVLHERHPIDALGREVANAEQAAWPARTSPSLSASTALTRAPREARRGRMSARHPSSWRTA